MSTPRFRKFIKSIVPATPGSDYYPGGQSTLDELKLVIPDPTSTILGDVLVTALGTAVLTGDELTSITLTEAGDGYITAPVPYLVARPTSILNTTIPDSRRDAGTYANVATTSNGIGTDLLVTLTVDSVGGISSITPSQGTDFAVGDIITISSVAIGGLGIEDDITAIVTKINNGSGATFTVELDRINKAGQYRVDKTSPVIKNQLPEYILDEYPVMATFIEKYYEFNELNTTAYGIGPTNLLHTMQDRLDLDYLNDSEEVSTDFLTTFFEQYGKDFPVTLATTKDTLLKNVKDFYTAKGSVKAIELLFRIMYNETIEVFVPHQYTLRPSDNTWTKDYVIKVQANDLVGGANVYDPVNLSGKSVVLHYNESIGSVTTTKKKKANVTQVKKIAYTSPQTYELILDLDSSFVLTSNGTGFEATAVIGGKIATVDTIGAADVNRTTGTYSIGAGDYTTAGNGSGATFTVVVGGSGAATVTVIAAGDNFAPLETITIQDSQLGTSGTAAAALTFNVATIADGKIFGATITSGGSQYIHNPQVYITPNLADTISTPAVIESRITAGAVTSILFPTDQQGVGYNNVPNIHISSYPTTTFISLAGESGLEPEHKRALVQRILVGATYTSSSASVGGFRVGETFPVNEGTGLAEYAADYFAEDYTLTSIANNAFVRITQIGATGYPTALEVVVVGIGFQSSEFNTNIISRTGVQISITCTTGYSAVYPGVYGSSSGFLSNSNRLQDNKIYQSFSYQIRSERPKSDWGEYVKRAAHPAGMIGYADLQIRNVVDVGSGMTIATDLMFFVVPADIEVVLVQDVVVMNIESLGNVETVAVSDPISLGSGLVKSEVPVLLQDVPVIGIEPIFTEDCLVNESTIFTINSSAIDSYTIEDVAVLEPGYVRGYTESVDIADVLNNFYIFKISTDSIDVADSQALLVPNKIVAELIAMQDVAPITAGLHKTDSAEMADTNVVTFPTINKTDTGSMAESGNITQQDYVLSVDYFLENYVANEIRSIS